MKETKSDQALLTIEKRSKRIASKRQPKEDGQADLKVVNTTICGCNFGVPCCPEDMSNKADPL